MLNFVVTGCSFTAGVIPLPHTDAAAWQQQGSVWPHFIFAKMNPLTDTFKNLALPGGGNIAAFTNLIYYLETNKSTINSSNSIVGFNIAAPNRLDTICDVNDPSININLCCIDSAGITHPSGELGFGWITSGVIHRQHKTEILNYMAIIQALEYLEHHKFRYFFMLMNDAVYTYAPGWFRQALDSRDDSWIKFNSNMSMLGLVSTHNLCVSAQDRHPSTEGHVKIADYVNDFLTDKSWYAKA